MSKRRTSNPNSWGNVRIEKIGESFERAAARICYGIKFDKSNKDLIRADMKLVDILIEQIKIEYDINETK